MKIKRMIGFVLIAVSLVLAVIVFQEIQKTVTLSGRGIGSIAFYDAPFAHHGLLVVLGGIAAVVSLLAGLYLASPKREK